MTTLKNKPLLAIIAIGIATALAAVVFSVQSAAHAQEAFGGSGYVLQMEDTQTDDDAAAQESGDDSAQAVEPLVAPVAFAEDATYRRRFPDTVQFNDADGNKATVSQKSFVHYDDKSIAAFVKTVFVDLDHVNDPVVYYYDLPAGRTMEFEGGSWRLDNGGSELSFTHVLMKLDEAHYLVLSDDITFSVNGETQQNFKGAGSYLEVEYIEGGIVRFSNDQGSYQTIASDATVAVGNGVSVNFGDKLVSTEDGAKLSLDQMVIDADDNIEISPEAAAALAGGEEGEEGAEGEAGAEGGAAGGTTVIGGGGASASGGAGGSSSSSSGAVAGGVAGDGTQGDTTTDGEDGEDEEEGGDVLEDANDSRKTPSFAISDGSTSPVGFNANISITDEENMLSSGTTVTIVDRETGKVVYESSVAAGVLDFDISAAGLDPDKEYVLSATATYKDGDQEYTKSFLDKVFKTDPVGIMMNKAYAATDALGINVQVGAYANVVNAKLRLLNEKGEPVETKDIDVSGARVEGGVDVAFENLTSNSVYAAELCDVTYSNVTVDSFGDALALKTLRRAPELPAPVSTPDRRTQVFELELPEADIKDPDAGIAGYTWEVYRAEDVQLNAHGEAVFSDEPVWSANPAVGTKVSLPVDNITIRSGESYLARVLVTFDDNEKVITFDTPFTQAPFSMDGMAFPTVHLEDTEVTFERYVGTLVIDNAAAIDRTKPVQIIYRDSIGNSVTLNPTLADVTSGSIAVPLDLNNLRSNTTYSVQVNATYNLNDGNDSVTGFIGAAKFTTLEPDPIAGEFVDLKLPDKPFSVSLKLLAQDAKHDIDLEMHTMSTLRVELYEGAYVPGTSAPIASTLENGETSVDHPYSGKLYDKIYQNSIEITPEYFGLSSSQIKANQSYTVVVGNAKDYTRNFDIDGNEVANDLPIVQGNTYTFATANTWPDPPTDPTTAIAVKTILNGQAKSYGGEVDASLEPDTVVGYRLESQFDNTNDIAREITYNVIDAVTQETVYSTSLEVPHDGPEDGKVPAWVLFFKDADGKVTRGHEWRFSYTMKISLTDTGDQIQYPACIPADQLPPAPEGMSVYELTSPTMPAPYEAAKISMYLEKMNGKGQPVWRWVAKDPDRVLDQERHANLRAKFFNGSASLGNMKIEEGADWTKNWQELTVNKSTGSYSLRLRQYRYVYEDTKKFPYHETVLTDHYLDKSRTWNAGTGNDFHEIAPTMKDGELDVTTGELALVLKSNLSKTDLNAAAAVELTFQAGSEKIGPLTAIPREKADGSMTVRVSLRDIQSLLGKEFTVSAQVIYDTGAFGMKGGDDSSYTGMFAFQELSNGNSLGRYVPYVGGSAGSHSLPTADVAGGGNITMNNQALPEFSVANAFANDPGNMLDYPFTVLDGKKSKATAKLRSSSSGMMIVEPDGTSSGTAVVAKHLARTDDAVVANGSYKFDKIPPIISRGSFTVGVDRASVSVTTELISMEAEHNGLIVKLEEKLPDGTWKTKGTYTYENVINPDVAQTLTIPPHPDTELDSALEPGKKYAVTFSAKVRKKGGEDYKEITAIDKSSGRQARYEFNTLSDVKVDLTNVTLVPSEANPYAEKNLVVTYDLAQKDGFDTKIEVFAASDNNEPVGEALISHMKHTAVQGENKENFEFNPGGANSNKMPLGKSYIAVIECFTKGDNPTSLGSTTHVFRLDKLDKPVVNISARPETPLDTEAQKKAEEAMKAAREAEMAAAAARAEEAAKALEAAEAERAAQEAVAAETASSEDSSLAGEGVGLPSGDAVPGTDGSASDAAADPASGDTAAPADGPAVAAGVTVGSEAPEVSGEPDAVAEPIRKFNLHFNVSIFDIEGSLVGGTYKVRFFEGDTPVDTEYDDPGAVFKTSDVNKQFSLMDLKESTSYTIKVYGVVDDMNKGGKADISNIEDLTNEYLIATAEGHTTPESGVEVGEVTLTKHEEFPNRFTMNFFGSVNLSLVKNVRFTTYNSTAVVKTGTLPFALTEKTLVGGVKYYTFSPEIELPNAGYYTTQMTYLGQNNEVLATGTYDYALSEDSTAPDVEQGA